MLNEWMDTFVQATKLQVYISNIEKVYNRIQVYFVSDMCYTQRRDSTMSGGTGKIRQFDRKSKKK